MTPMWMLGALAAGALLSLAAAAAETVAGWFRLPRRWAWAAALAGSLLLPAVSLALPGALPHLRLPSWTARSRPAPPPTPAAAGAVEPADAPGYVAVSELPAGLPRGVLAAWLAASLATLGTFAWTRRRLRSACGRCVPRRVAGQRVLVSDRAGPLVLGLLDAQIVLPRWTLDEPDECRLIVRHEREHVRAGDPWLLALGAVAVAAVPWSPALWWQHRRLRLAVETDCDARVLAAGESRHRYGRVLLRTAAHPLFLPAPSLAWADPSSQLERRILAMTARPPAHRALRALPLSLFACAVAAAACGVASGGAPTGAQAGAARRSGAAIDTTTHTEMWQGRVTTHKQLPNGTELVSLGPDPAAATHGSPGFSWRYDYSAHPLVVSAGPPFPPNTVYPSVWKILPGSPAEKAGLQVGDVFLSSNGVDGRVTPLMPDRRPGAAYTFRVRRGNEEREIHLVLGPPYSAAEGRYLAR